MIIIVQFLTHSKPKRPQISNYACIFIKIHVKVILKCIAIDTDIFLKGRKNGLVLLAVLLKNNDTKHLS